MAVFPVYLSPIMSSLYPLPIGTKASTALTPVYIGSCTDFLGMIPGALTSTFFHLSVLIGPLPSIGFPKASNTLPSISSPTGISTIRPVLMTISPS